MKLKRELNFEKIKRNREITKGEKKGYDEVYSYESVSDAALVNYAIALTAKYDAELVHYSSDERLVSTIGHLVFRCSKENFIAIVGDFLDHFKGYITFCQF